MRERRVPAELSSVNKHHSNCMTMRIDRASGGDQPNELFVLRAFCSDANVGGPAWEIEVRPTQHASSYVDLWAGQAVVFAVYLIREDAFQAQGF